MNKDQSRGQPTGWNVAKVYALAGNTSSMCVVVKKSSERWPRFDLQIARQDGERTASFFPIKITEAQGRVSIGRVDLTGLADAMQSAQEWIHEECQKLLDTDLAEQQRREMASLKSGQPKQKPGLKELSKRDARAKGLSPKNPTE